MRLRGERSPEDPSGSYSEHPLRAVIDVSCSEPGPNAVHLAAGTFLQSLYLAEGRFCNPFTLRWDCSAMEPLGRVIGPANTRYFYDYVGPVAADDAEVVQDQPSLYELANIDRDRYTILAFDLRIEGPATATVFAIDRLEERSSLIDTPVVSFEIPEPSVEDLIRHAFKRIAIRFVTQPFRDLALVASEPTSAS
jgi:hypothetical protein